MNPLEVEFLKWNEFTRRWSEPIKLHKPTPGMVMEWPETFAMALCMSGPMSRDREDRINLAPIILGALGWILFGLIVSGII